MKLSLGLICHDEVEQFDRILKDYGRFFDEIVIAVDDKLDEFKKIESDTAYSGKIKVLPYKWINDFSDKRNYVHKNITGDWYLRLDMDDAIKNPEKLREVAENADKNGLSIVYLYYLYSKDQWGNCNAAHWREGLIKATDNLFWNKKIHENLLPINKNDYRFEMNDDVAIEHLVDESHVNKSIVRNIKYLLDEYKQDGENTDSRTLSYLGRMLHGIHQFDKAIFFLEKHIKTSGWDEDRYMSWCSLADCYRRLGNMSQATGAAFEALQEKPDYPDAYLRLHDIYFDQENWEKAYEWGRQGLTRQVPRTFMLQDPCSYGWLPTVSMAHCAFQMNKFDEALKLLLLAKKDVPSLDYIRENEPLYRKAVESKNFMEKFLGIVNLLKDKGEEKKITPLLSSVPKEFENDEVVIRLKHYYTPVRRWEKNEIAIFAGGSPEEWSPDNTKKGIGGSEEAVIHMSRQLSDIGYKVTVYTECGEKCGDYGGVEWKNLVHFNPKDKFNILIAWRSNIFTNKIQARKKIIWLHDMPTNMEFTEDTVKTFDHIVALSKYHASMLKGVPQEKIFVSTNGINPADFDGVDTSKRVAHRVIYASSYNRGLEYLLKIWKDVRKEIPDAELHCYYGWDIYDKYVKNGWLKESGFKDRMLKLFDQEGVFEHGRIGHKELIAEYAKAGVFAYPCIYEGEINCIALTKAIACGCKVVTNKFAVMAERSPNAVDDDKFKEELIKTIKSSDGNGDLNWDFIQNNSWEAVAEDWHKRLLPMSVPVEVDDRVEWIHKNFTQDDKIIDIGANKGHIFYGWDRKNITSVDIDKYDYEGFIQADAKNIPVPDKSYDKALLAEIVEHVPDPIEVLKEARRVAKKVVITVPYEFDWDSGLKPFNNVERDAKEQGRTIEELAREGNPEALEFHKDGFKHLWHHTFYTPELLREHLEKAGFKNIYITKIRFAEWYWLGAVCD